MTERRRRYAALRGKITPSTRDRFGSADFGGTVGRMAQGRAEEARDLDEQNPVSHSAGGHELASEVSERIRAIISSAEAAANAVRHEAEQRAQVKRRVAEEEARRIVDGAREDAEAFLAERIRRIAELSDAVVERGEGIVLKLDRAEEVRRQLQELADALGESAEELARDLGADTPTAATGTPAAATAPGATTPTSKPAAARPEPATVKPPPLRPPTEPAPPEEAEAVDDSTAEVVDAEIADDPTVGELAGEAPEADEEVQVVAVELVPDEPQADPEPAAAREPDEQLSARLVALQMAVAGGKRGEVESHLQRTFQLGDVTQILDDVFGSGDGDDPAGWPGTRDGAA
ncbi:MAG: hypothetical protein QOE06_864 [Thermoleophilaceae bacterium]|nr:hypothetical protein [Thermoleophilaceae bacterium]